MEQQVQNQLSGSINPEAVKALIGGKVKRNSSKKAAKIVKNSVPASKRKTKITQEQGFRNYLQYTDPLLLNNNEVDKSDIANSLANLLNVFSPKKMETDKLTTVQKFVATQKPVDVNDVNTEINPSFKTPSKQIKQIQDKSATKIASMFKGKQTKDAYKNIRNSAQTDAENGTVLQGTGSYDIPLYVTVNPNKKKKNEFNKIINNFAQELEEIEKDETPIKIIPRPKKVEENVRHRYNTRHQNKNEAAKTITRFIKNTASVKRIQKSGILEVLKPSEKKPRELKSKRD